MNIGTFITLAAQRHPERPAFIYGDEITSWREANARVNALALALKRLGLEKGDRVGVYMWNCPQLLESFFAIWKAGACVVPLNARFLPDEVVYHAGDPRAKFLIIGEEMREGVAQVRSQLGSVAHVIAVRNPLEGQLDYEQLLAQNATDEEEVADVADNDLAWLFYTSGTTGRPKGAMLTHANLSFVAVSWVADLMHLEPEDITLHAAPVSHGAGFHALAATAKACTQVIPSSPKFDAAAFCGLIERHRVTNTWLVPTQIKLMLNLPDLEKYDMASLKYMAYGGAPMYVEDLKEGLRRIGPVFVQLFGQGESPMTGTYLRREDHIVEGPVEQVARLASCGHARTGMEVRIFDEQDRECPRGQIGTICLRGPSVMAGYWERPEATAETLRGGWLHTGDLGYMDQAGYVYILDRSKDMIISGGSNIYPREIEEVILQHPAVAEACVVGVPDEIWGEAARAVLVVRVGMSVTAEEIIAFVGSRVANYKKPKSVDFVVELPKSAYGKILKREVRARYWQGRTRAV